MIKGKVNKPKAFKKKAAQVKKLGKLRDYKLTVGIQGPEAEAIHADSDVRTVDVATFHEFGTSRVPERSFIRATVDEKEDEIRKLQKRVANGVKQGKLTEEKALELLGLKVQGDMVARVRANIPPPLKPQTIKRKGSSVALIDSGQLVQAITFKVSKAGLKK